MITLKEIAEECKVSATTVSNILNGKPKVSEETKARVLAIVKKRGYRPNYIAQGLRNQKTRTIGIVAEDIVQFTTPAMVESIMACCEEKGYRTVLQNLRLYARWRDSWFDDEKAYRSVLEPALQEMSSIKVDGLIYVAGHTRALSDFSEEFRKPRVIAYAYEQTAQCPSIIIDDEQGGYDMMKYLLSMGHRRIGVIAGRADNIHSQKRLLGLQKALFEAGVPYNPEWVRYGEWDRASGYREASSLVETGVSVIFCLADLMARGVYDYLEEQGIRVGEEISVAGFDNNDAAEYSSPGITTMKLPLFEIGHRAAELLLNRLENETEEMPQTTQELGIAIPCTLLERQSVKRISGV